MQIDYALILNKFVHNVNNIFTNSKKSLQMDYTMIYFSCEVLWIIKKGIKIYKRNFGIKKCPPPKTYEKEESTL